MTSMLRVVLLSEMLQPYRIPVFNSIVEEQGVELSVLTLSIREKNRQWEVPLDSCRFSYQVLPGKDIYIRSLDWGLHLSWGVRAALRRLSPDVIVGTGYASPAFLAAQKYARIHHLGYVLWSGSSLSTSRIGKGPLRWMKRRFLSRCDAFLSYGTDASHALVKLGADPSRIITGCNTVDVDFFARIAREARESSTFRQWRSRFPPRLVLFIGQMLERKGVMDLIQAYQQARCHDLGLVLLGDGPEMENYRRLTEGIQGIFWEGFVQTREMGPYLAASDVLVMPSYLEPWGLVVNEAMAAGIPVIATTCSGATTDLVRDGRTGYAFRAGDVERLTELLRSVAQEPEKWRKMGEEAALQMKSCAPEDYARAFLRAVRLAVEKVA